MATRIAPEGADVLEFFADWLDGISEPEHREIAEQVLSWINRTYPQLGFRFAWRQPMFTLGPTFIIGFSPASKHLAVAPEGEGIKQFEERFAALKISHGTKMFRLPWTEPMPFDLLADVIEFNIREKDGMTSFWR